MEIPSSQFLDKLTKEQLIELHSNVGKHIAYRINHNKK